MGKTLRFVLTFDPETTTTRVLAFVTVPDGPDAV